MRVAGYGRANRIYCAPKAHTEPSSVKDEFSHDLENVILHAHKQAINHGFHVTTPEEWPARCMGMWRSTSSGVKPATITIPLRGVRKRVKLRNKMSIGSYYGSTTGVRIVDNPSTIGSSGCSELFDLDLDFSSFDQHAKMDNFRGPFMRVMNIVAQTLPEYLYGSDKLSFSDLIEYGFGVGFVYGTWWDNGRTTVLYVNPDEVAEEDSAYFKTTVVGPALPSINALGVGSAISNKTVSVFESVDGVYDNSILKKYVNVLKTGFFMDGSDRPSVPRV
ncbi:hypothetical protein M8J75_005802 [Diaphorina citri]|nr:hypothetical protein M8J75_005802 [Diaphorina citri]